MTEKKDKLEQEVLKNHGRAIVHMWQQMSTKRLCLVFGAGAGYDLGFPKWEELLFTLGENLKGFAEAKIAAAGDLVKLAQLLVKLFEYDFAIRDEEWRKDNDESDPSLNSTLSQKSYSARLNAAWRDLIHDTLYVNIDTLSDKILLQKDCYYKAFLKIIKNSPITITYNFDDSIQRFLANPMTGRGKIRKMGYTTIFDENSQLPTNFPIIYHPNGYLSHLKKQKPSTHLILTEDSFREQLSDSISGRHAVIQSELAQKTCLIVGSSLADPTLNYLLKKNANHHPGHYHYYVHWSGDDGLSTSSQADRDRLFELYNLITLNLSTDAIKTLGDLLSDPMEDLRALLVKSQFISRYTYVVTGAVGSGRGSVISHFRSLKQHDDWLAPSLDRMAQQVTDLKDSDVDEIDLWVDEQWAKKNLSLTYDENMVGLHILNRGPLDPLAFTKDGDIARRGKSLLRALKIDDQNDSITPAHIILLTADSDEMATRATARGKIFDAKVLTQQEDKLREVYGHSAAVSVIDTRGLTIQQTVRRIAKIIHLERYVELNLTQQLTSISNNNFQLPLFPD